MNYIDPVLWSTVRTRSLNDNRHRIRNSTDVKSRRQHFSFHNIDIQHSAPQSYHSVQHQSLYEKSIQCGQPRTLSQKPKHQKCVCIASAEPSPITWPNHCWYIVAKGKTMFAIFFFFKRVLYNTRSAYKGEAT